MAKEFLSLTTLPLTTVSLTTEMDDGRWTITVARTGQPLAGRARMATSLRQRMIGLLGQAHLPEGEALVFPRCRSIHMCGMRFPIDAIFVDRAWRVVEVKPHLAPWRMVWPVWKAWGVMEAPAGRIDQVGLHVGDQLEVTEGGI